MEGRATTPHYGITAGTRAAGRHTSPGTPPKPSRDPPPKPTRGSQCLPQSQREGEVKQVDSYSLLP